MQDRAVNVRPDGQIMQTYLVADIKETWAVISKAESLLGSQPQTNPEQELPGAIARHLADRECLYDVLFRKTFAPCILTQTYL